MIHGHLSYTQFSTTLTGTTWRRPACRIKDASRRYAVPKRASLTRQPVRHRVKLQGRDEEQGFSGPNKEHGLGTAPS